MAETFPIPFGRYELIERLAIGGMAELFRAREVDDQPPGELAIKRLLPHLAVESYYREMFLDEAKLTARLSHPNIIHAHDYGVYDGHLYIAMELVDGLDGLSILRECAQRKVRMPAEVAVYATHQVLSALTFAHVQVDDKGEPLGVVHRDISPANVLFSKNGEIKLADFGIAHAAQHQHRTKDGTLKGKYGYMSPEQVNGVNVDARSDVFSAGVLLAEMLIGRRLFSAASELDVLLMVRDVNLERLEKYGTHVGVDLDRILRKALKKDPEKRFDSSEEFKEALAEWMHLHHQEEMSVADIRELVEMLYDDAWARKRERTAKLMAGISSSERDPANPGVAGGGIARGRGRADASDSASGSLLASGASTSAEALDAPDASPATRSQTVQIGRIALSSRVADTRQSSVQRIPPTGQKDAPISVRDRVVENLHLDGFTEENTEPSASISPGAISNTTEIPAYDNTGERDAISPSGKLLLADLEQPAIHHVSYSDVHGVAAMASDERVGDEAPPAPVARSAIADVEAVGAAQMPDFGTTDSPPDESGTFADAAPIRVFFRLAVSKATGLLVTRVGGVRKEIYVRDGLPEYVASNVASELFGEYLVNLGIISSGELSMALAMMPHYGGKLGETLVDLGLLQPLDVFRYLSQQLREKLTDLYTWSKGTYDWYSGRENPHSAFPLALNAFEMLGASIRSLPEHVLEKWANDVHARRPRAVRQPPVPLEVFGLGRALELVWRELDGVRSIRELRASHVEKGDETTWLRIMYLLAHTEQIIL